MNEHVHAPTLSERADELEEKMMAELGERVATKSVLFGMADGKIEMVSGFDFKKNNPDKYFLMGADPRLPQMPKKPTLIDFFKNRFASLNHLLAKRHAGEEKRPQREDHSRLPSARHRRRRLHPLRPRLLGRADDRTLCRRGSELGGAHAPGVRFFPDTSVGYEYPQMYINNFGADYKPEPYIVRDYESAKNHKWYMTSRMICVNDIYSFIPTPKSISTTSSTSSAATSGSPKEGLGFDDLPSAHMWRTLMWPTRYL